MLRNLVSLKGCATKRYAHYPPEIWDHPNERTEPISIPEMQNHDTKERDITFDRDSFLKAMKQLAQAPETFRRNNNTDYAHEYWND